jgi:outer membrane protein OmpA-like peptidoglycan-associated protein
MRPLQNLSFLALSVAVSVCAATSASTRANAQVTVDLHALQALPDQTSGPPSVVRRAPVRRNTRAEVPPLRQEPRQQLATTEPSAQQPSSGAAPQATQPALPTTVPPTASINPVAPTSEATPPPPPVSANAATTAAPTKAGLRVTFAPGQSDLSPESATAIKQLTTQLGASESATYSISAYAPGKPDDPSTARRLSLSRAMSVRTALVADGVPSPRIFVRALGAPNANAGARASEDPPDRVDLDVQGATTAEATGK